MTSGSRIQEELMALGGVNALKLEPSKINQWKFLILKKILLENWPVSDDTVLHLAVAENLTENKDLSPGIALHIMLQYYYYCTLQVRHCIKN